MIKIYILEAVKVFLRVAKKIALPPIAAALAIKVLSISAFTFSPEELGSITFWFLAILCSVSYLNEYETAKKTEQAVETAKRLASEEKRYLKERQWAKAQEDWDVFMSHYDEMRSQLGKAEKEVTPWA